METKQNTKDNFQHHCVAWLSSFAVSFTSGVPSCTPRNGNRLYINLCSGKSTHKSKGKLTSSCSDNPSTWGSHPSLPTSLCDWKGPIQRLIFPGMWMMSFSCYLTLGGRLDYGQLWFKVRFFVFFFPSLRRMLWGADCSLLHNRITYYWYLFLPPEVAEECSIYRGHRALII